MENRANRNIWKFACLKLHETFWKREKIIKCFFSKSGFIFLILEKNFFALFINEIIIDEYDSTLNDFLNKDPERH